MKRLTHRNEDGKAAVWVYADPEKPAEVIAAQRRAEEAVIEKLAHYEELEEAGRLAVLPEGDRRILFFKALAYSDICPSSLGLEAIDCSPDSDCVFCWKVALEGGGRDET